MGGIPVDPSRNYDRCLALNPRVGDAIRGAVRACARLPVRSIICSGSIPLGGYIPHHSDIDLLVVTAGPPEGGPWPGLLVELGAPGLHPPLLLAEGDLAKPEPIAVRGFSPRREYRLHAIDLILLKRYSVVVHGADVRGAIPDLREADVIGGIVRHVRDVMVADEMGKLAKGGGGISLAATDIVNVGHVMIRCLYTVKEGALTSKPAALAWAIREYGRDSRFEPLVRFCQGLESLLGNDEACRRELPGQFREAAPVWAGLVGDNAGGGKP